MMSWAWSLRPLVLFVAAYTIIGVVHESAHVVTAYLFKVPFVLSHLYVEIDRAAATMNERAVIGWQVLCRVSKNKKPREFPAAFLLISDLTPTFRFPFPNSTYTRAVPRSACRY